MAERCARKSASICQRRIRCFILDLLIAHTPTIPSTPDLFAGLTSQGNDEEEEVPDWLVKLTGRAPAKKKMNEPEAEDTQVKWVELGGHENFEEPIPSIGATQTPSEISVENTTPSWMVPQEPAPEKDELADWLSRAAQSSASSSAPVASFQSTG